MWRHIDVQADWRRSLTYGRAPNAIDISQGSLTCPSKHRHGTTLFIRWFRHTAPFSRLLRSRWGYGGHILDLTPRALTGEIRFRSAKAPPKASQRIFFAGPSGRRIFSPWNQSRNFFFAKSSCPPPPPHKIKWLLPYFDVMVSPTSPPLPRRLAKCWRIWYTWRFPAKLG